MIFYGGCDEIEQSPPRPLRHALALVWAASIAAGVICGLLAGDVAARVLMNERTLAVLGITP